MLTDFLYMGGDLAGFGQLKWTNLTLAAGNNVDFWQDWLDNCPIILFSAFKPKNTDLTRKKSLFALECCCL